MKIKSQNKPASYWRNTTLQEKLKLGCFIKENAFIAIIQPN